MLAFTKKVLIVIITLVLFNVIAFAQNDLLDKKITLKVAHIPLSGLLTELTKQTGTRFSYGSTIDLSQKVTIAVSDVSFKDVLNQALNPFSIKWELIGNQVALSPDKKKYYKTEGIIRDSTTKSPIQFASVSINGNAFSTSTDFNGKFIFSKLAPGTYTLSAYAFGYKVVIQSIKVQDQPAKVVIDLPQQGILLAETIIVSDKIIERNSVSQMEILPAQIESGKGVANDPMNSISALPGILGKMDIFGSQEIHIRGGEGFENQFLLDNIRIPYPFYFFGPSVFNPEILEKAEVLTGGYAPNYGNSMSSIFNLTTKNGDMEKHSGGFDLNFLTRTGVAQGPIAKNKLSFIVSTRRVNLDFILPAIYPKIKTFSMSDFTSKVTYAINPKNKLSLTNIFVSDKHDFTDSSEAYPGLKSKGQINAQNIQWQSVWGEKTYSKTSFLYSGQTIDSKLDTLFNKTSNNYVGFREDLSFFPNPATKLKAGVEVNFEGEKSDALEYYKATDIAIIDSAALISSRKTDTTNITRAAYFYYDGIILKRLLVNAGVRFDYNRLNRTTNTSPRITLGYQLTESILLSASWGIFSQKPTIFQLTQNSKLRSNQCQHTILSLKQKIKEDVYFKAEAYYKDYKQLILFDTAFVFSNNGYGIAKGLELMLSKEKGRLNGWVSYALAKSDRKRNLQDGAYPYYFDQRHSVNVALNYSLKHKQKVWIIPHSYGIDFRYSTGVPYTPVTGVDSLAGNYTYTTGPVNSARNPDYNNLNIKIAWQKLFGKNKHHLMQFYINVWNFYSQPNIIDRVYSIDPSSKTLSVKKQYAVTFFPNVGLKINFNYF